MASTSKHRQKRLVGLLDAFKLSIPRLDLSLRNPLWHSSLEVLNVVSVDVVIPEDEALDLDASAEDLRQVGDAVLFLNWFVVLRCLDSVSELNGVTGGETYCSAADDAAEPFHVLNGSLEMITADILKDNV